MTFYWVYSIPNSLFCLLCIVFGMAICVVGLYATRGFARRVFGPNGQNDLVSYFLSATGVFYGITLGLIAIGAWQNFDAVSGKVSQEAAVLATMCQDVRAMPPSETKDKLNAALKEYTRYTIEDAWPIQRQGIVPKGGTERVTAIHEHILGMKLTTEMDKIVATEMLQRLNSLIVIRRQRLEAVTSGLPSILYWIVFVGGAVNLGITWMFVTDRVKAHASLCACIGALIGLLIFMVAAMDNPFRGEYSVGPDAFQLIYDRYFTS